MTRTNEAPGTATAAPQGRSRARQKGDRLVEAQARRQVQTFFAELKNGTRNYRTVASLREQVAQEYRGRAILELLQNAHDALAGADPEDPRRISFVLTSSPEPELLVANSGRPFSRKDFEGICQLAQSAKDPNESVGNKGLGFQSVLEVSTRPEIWSTMAAEGGVAFAFRFDPAVRKAVAEMARNLADGRPQTDGTALEWKEPAVDWSSNQIDAYRHLLRRNRIDTDREVNEFLSPYLLPLTLGATPYLVEKLLAAGHTTVIRLPLDGGRTGTGEEAVKAMKGQLRTLQARSMVFLRHLEMLTIQIDGERTELERTVVPEPEQPPSSSSTLHHQLLVRGKGPQGETESSRFHLWSRVIGGEEDCEEADRIAAAVGHLPNRWPEVSKVEVAVAVQEPAAAGRGVFVIFLPTEMSTGTGAHINAPFYGSLDRRQINFNDEYNELLLEYVLELCLDAAMGLVKGNAEGWRGRAVVDLLASTDRPTDSDAPSLMERLRQRELDRGGDLSSVALILCDEGWNRPADARTMPHFPEDDLIGKAHWRERAGFAVVSDDLDGRRGAVRALLAGLGGSPDPTEHEWANTIDRLAAQVRDRRIDIGWHEFLNSVLAALPPELRSESRGPAPDPLANARILPTHDGRLLSASDPAQVFFRPRRGADDAAEFVGRIPDSLQDRIAFLHRDVRTHEGPQQRNTQVQKFLDGRFAQNFRREDLLRDVVVPALPDLPVPHGCPDARRCSEILDWTLALVGRGEPEIPSEAPGLHTASTLLPLLRNLPVGCGSGWVAIRDAIFGPGWPGRQGARVEELATELRSSGHDHAREAAERLSATWLLPPGDRRWGNAAIEEEAAIEERADFLAQAGVVDGLRLRTADPRRFSMSATDKSLPRKAPESTPQKRWNDWRQAARTEVQLGYVSFFEYELSGVYLLPELDSVDDLAAAGQRALSELILVSLVHWKEGWERTRITKKKGSSWSTTVSSPLRHWLRTLPWLLDGQRRPRTLDQRWLVPESLLQGQRGRFSHLAALSLKLAHRLSEERELRKALERLGLQVYPTEDDRTGPELLEALAVACDEGEMPAGGFDVLLGQVRHAWRYMDPARGLPSRFLVRTRPRSFEIRGTEALTDVYIPDHGARTRSLREQGKPILEMHADEARRAVGARLDEMRVRRASALSERCLADDRPAGDAAQRAPSLDETELRWLPVVLLTLAAHGGANPRGPATDAWQEAAARLRRARILGCGGISVELVDGDQVVAANEPAAHWLSAEAVLVLRHDAKSSYDELASACQAMLERQDLLKDLRLVLGALQRAAPEPTQEQIAAALDRAEIDSELLGDIRHRWYGPTTLLVDRVRPLVKLLEIPDDGLDAAAADVEALTQWLSSHLPAREAREWPEEEVVRTARSSRNDFEMGREAWRRLGELAPLPAWNAALTELGDRYAAVENSDASEQAKRHVQEAAPLLRALARNIAIKADDSDLFGKVEEVTRNFEAAADWSIRWWEVPLDAVLAALNAAYVKDLGVELHLVEALDGASTLADLRLRFAQRDIPIDPDPYDTARRNKDGLANEIRLAHDVYRAWIDVFGQGCSPTPEAPDVRLDSSAYLRSWSPEDLFQRALATIDDRDFSDRCAGCPTAQEARSNLGLSPEAVEQARRRRQERKRADDRANRTFDIAGKPFEVDGAESYGDLLARFDTLPEPEGPCARRDEQTPLVYPGSSPKSTPRPGPPELRRTSHLYSSPHLPGLVGIVGEMHAYRYLQSQFGSQAVTPAAWVSENGLRVLPPVAGERRDASDSHGFDFRFQFEGKTWCVEVKATTGDDTSFDLPASEIHAATRLAHSRRERWRILRVRNARTDRPEFDWLPNPFETGFGKLFRLNTGGMTVRYALDAAT